MFSRMSPSSLTPTRLTYEICRAEFRCQVRQNDNPRLTQRMKDSSFRQVTAEEPVMRVKHLGRGMRQGKPFAVLEC